MAGRRKTGEPGGERARGPVLGALLVLLLSVGLNAPSLGRWFDNPDDWDHLDAADGLLAGEVGAWREVFVGDLGVASMRPAPTLLWAADRALWGWNASGFFLSNLLLHGALALCTFLLALRLSRSSAAATVAGVFVGLSVASHQATYYLAGRDDQLANLGFVAALLCWRAWPGRGRVALTTGLTVLAALSKPTALLLPVALLAMDWLLPDGERPSLRGLLRAQWPVWGASAVIGAALFVVVRGGSGLMPPISPRPLAALVHNIGVAQLLPGWVRQQRMILLALDLPRLLLMALVVGGALFAGGRGRALLGFGGVVMGVGLLLPLPFLASEQFELQDSGRYLQLPTVGLALAIAGAVASARWRRAAAAALVAVSALGFAAGALPSQAGVPSLARGLYRVLPDAVAALGPEGRVVLSLARLDAGVVSFLASDGLAELAGGREVVLVRDGDDTLRASARGGERLRYGSFASVARGWSPEAMGADEVLLMDVGGEGEPRIERVALPLPPSVPGEGAQWRLDVSTAGWSLFGGRDGGGRDLRPEERGGPRPGEGFAVPSEWNLVPHAMRNGLAHGGSWVLQGPPVELDPRSICAAELTLELARPPGPERGLIQWLMPTGFAMLAFSDGEDAARLARFVLLPLEAGSGVLRVELSRSVQWRTLSAVRSLALVPSNRPGTTLVRRVELLGCP